jgi:serine acetyltransferase
MQKKLNKSLLKYILKKIYIGLYLKQIIRNNHLVQEDALHGLKMYGSSLTGLSAYKAVEHMLIYYPAYAFIFRYRTKVKSRLFHNLFIPTPFAAKIFGGTKIEGGLTCFHPFATVINAQTIGKNFTFRNGLTIGNKANDNAKLPAIGDDVEVGANVVIIGEIQIGNNVTIGAGSVVVKDVPDNVVIAGNPAKIIKEKARVEP